MKTGSSPAKSLFRENALRNLNAVEEIPATFKLIQPSSWLGLMICVLLLAGLLVWGILGRLTMTVQAPGLILSEEQLQRAERRLSEELQDRQTKAATLKFLLDKKRILFNKHYLTLDELEKAEEEYIAAKNELNNSAKTITGQEKEALGIQSTVVDPSDRAALVFVKNSEGKKIAAGMAALVVPHEISPYQYGYIKGKVVSVSEYPTSKERAYAYLGNMNLVDEFFTDGVPFLVKIKLSAHAKTSSGLAWTSHKGPPTQVKPGSTVTAEIINKVTTPLKLLIQTD